MSAGTIKSICQLTDREVEVARMVSLGHKQSDIAIQLGVSQKTVEGHVTHIYCKTRTYCIANLTRWVIANLETEPTAFFKV
jgi:DNA-binding NarL/FixJ family response regulator